jgi:enoyl-[acyl-carrier protein] reductase I
MGILAGKNVLVTGVLTESSIAFHIARIAQEEGASVVLTSFGRALSITNRIATRLPKPAPVLELDVTNVEHLDRLASLVKEHLPHLDGVVHSIGFAPEAALGGNFLNTTWEDVAWPKYDWMGVAKAGLESANRYLARDLGAENIRCNLIAAGPIKTMAAKSIPGFQEFEDVWNERAPLFWDVADPVPAAQGAVALLSPFFPKTTGEIIHVDGGVHAIGS